VNIAKLPDLLAGGPSIVEQDAEKTRSIALTACDLPKLLPKGPFEM
jgi:hypothetical protein